MLAQAIKIQLTAALDEGVEQLRLSSEMLKVQSPKWGLLWSYMEHCAQSICLEQGPNYSNV